MLAVVVVKQQVLVSGLFKTENHFNTSVFCGFRLLDNV